MTALGAWVLFPLVALAVATGLALLAGRVVRAMVPAPLLAPVGLFLAIAVVLPVYKLGGHQAIAAGLLVVLAIAGHVLERRGWRERVNPGWPGLAGVLAYGLFLAPVVLSGHATWLGYNFVNDTAVNLVMIDHVAHHGIALSTGPESTAKSLINGTLASQYPMGTHSLVASLHAIVGFLPLVSVYQPFIALTAAAAAASFAWLAGRAGARGPIAAGIGLVAAGGNLAYWYASHGAFKELAMVAMVAVSAALCALIAERGPRLGWVAQLGAVFAASVGIFATAALAYVGVFAVALLAALLAGRVRPRVGRLARATAAGIAAMLVCGFAGLSDAISYGRGASNYYAAAGGLSGANSTAFLGHLLRPLPLPEAAGVWLGSDYRVPLAGTGGTLTAALELLVGVLIVVALVAEIRHRRPAAVFALAAGLLVYLVASPRLGPYAEAKLLVILTPVAVFTALMGAVWIGRRIPVAGVIAAVLVAIGVLGSDAFAYHNARIAPLERLDAFEDAAAHAPARGLVLVPEWEEWAKYLTAGRQLDVAAESFSPRPVQLRTYFPYFAHSLDLDQMTLPYADSFGAVILRRGPDVSRPPDGFRLAYENPYYAVWEKAASGPKVLDHLPLQATDQAVQVPACRQVRRMVRAAGPGQRVIGAARAPVRLFDYTNHPPIGWNPGASPHTVFPATPGIARGPEYLPAGRYRVWLRGSTGRRLVVRVDGRVVGRPIGVNTPDTWLPAGAVTINRTGSHEVELERPGGGLGPGNGFTDVLGPIAFEPANDRDALQTIGRRDVASACARSWDWLERVRP